MRNNFWRWYSTISSRRSFSIFFNKYSSVHLYLNVVVITMAPEEHVSDLASCWVVPPAFYVIQGVFEAINCLHLFPIGYNYLGYQIIVIDELLYLKSKGVTKKIIDALSTQALGFFMEMEERCTIRTENTA